MRKWRQNAKMLTALKTLARMGVFKNSCETAGSFSMDNESPRKFPFRLPPGPEAGLALDVSPCASF
jgi:hypothetical protein